MFVRCCDLTETTPAEKFARITDRLDTLLASKDRFDFYPNPYGGGVYRETVDAALQIALNLMSGLRSDGVSAAIGIARGRFQRTTNVAGWNVSAVALNVAARLAFSKTAVGRVLATPRVKQNAGTRVLFGKQRVCHVKGGDYQFYAIESPPYKLSGRQSQSNVAARVLSRKSSYTCWDRKVVLWDIVKYSSRKADEQARLAQELAGIAENTLLTFNANRRGYSPTGDGGFAVFSEGLSAIEFARELIAHAISSGITIRTGIDDGQVSLARRGYVGPCVISADHISAMAPENGVAIRTEIWSDDLNERAKRDWHATDIKRGLLALTSIGSTAALPSTPPVAERRTYDNQAHFNWLRGGTREVGRRLPEGGTPPSGNPRRIAVLRFTEENAKLDPLGYGMAYALGRSLSKSNSLYVVGRTSTFETARVPADDLAKAKELKADLAVAGHIRVADASLSTSVQLIEVQTGGVLWSASYQIGITDAAIPVLQLQDRIANAILQVLNAGRMVAKNARAVPYANTLDSYNEYLRGRVYFNQRTPLAIKNAVTCLSQVLERESQYVPALCVLAECYVSLAFYGTIHPLAVINKARQTVVRAIQLEPSLPEALCTLGTIEAIQDWYWPRAELDFRTALEIDPGYAPGRWRYALNLLTPMGRFEEACAEAEHALSLDPISVMANAALGMVYYFARRYDESLKYSVRALQLDPHFYLASVTKGFTLDALGRQSHACEALECADKSAHNPMTAAALGYMYGRLGRSRDAEAILSGLAAPHGAFVSSFWSALVYAGLEDADSFFDNVSRAFTEPCGWLIFLNVWPVFDVYRQDKRAETLIQKLNLQSPMSQNYGTSPA